MIPSDLPVIGGQATLAVRMMHSLGGYMALLKLDSGIALSGHLRTVGEDGREAVVEFDVSEDFAGQAYELLLMDPNGEERLLRSGRLVMVDAARIEPTASMFAPGEAISVATSPITEGAEFDVSAAIAQQGAGAPRNVFVQAEDPGEQSEPWLWFELEDDGSLRTLWTGVPG